jgi:hypothetical protein
MNKIHIVAAIAAGLIAVLSAQQQSYAQYGDGIPVGLAGISDETLEKCKALGIDRTQCTESNVLLKERGNLIGGGSGTGFIAKEAGQMVTVIGILGAIFGGVAAAFFLMGKGKQVKTV